MNSLLSSAFISGRRGPVAALCLPILCACVMSLTGSTPKAFAKVPELPGLAFDQYMVDLREVAPSEEVFGYFGFTNTSQQPITITKLEPSCGCLQPKLITPVLKPGESGEFRLRIKTALQQPGFKQFSVIVHYADPNPRTQEVFLRITLPQEQIYVNPRSLTVHQLGSSPVEQDVIVTDLRATPAEVIGVTSSSDLLKLQVKDPIKTKNGAQQQIVRITVPSNVAPGRSVASIKIFTNDETFHEVTVPIQIYGPEKHSLTQRSIGPKMMGPVRR